MAHRDTDNYPYRPTRSSVSYDSTGGLSSRISSVSDFNSPETPSAVFYDAQASKLGSRDCAPSQPLIRNVTSRFNDSQNDGIDISHVHISSPTATPVEPRRFAAAAAGIPVSLRTGLPVESPTTAANRGKLSWVPSPGSHYEPLSPGGSSSSGKGFVGRLKRLSRHQSIPEGDELDMGNLNGFPFGGLGYTTIVNEPEQDEEISTLGVDISSFTGPMSPRDEATVKEYRRLESRGQLTGGLGAGLKPELRINSKDLWASASASVSTSPATPIDLTRGTSRRSGLSRAPTLRDLGQREANKQGKIIEVVVDDTFPTSGPSPDPGAPAAVDLSIVGGGNAPAAEFDPLQNRNGTFKLPKVVTYYPQPNWKPISMRWPYLTALIVISIGLAIAQEILYQRSQQHPKSGLFQFNTPNDISTWDYFLFKYLPTIIAVIYGILWQLTDFEVKRLEPYYRLSKEGGALAAESINVDYVTVFNIFRPFRALRYRHYAVAVSSIATLLAVSLVPTLQSASFVLEPDHDTRVKDPRGTKFINVNVVWSRVLSTTLLTISLFGFILLYQLQRRRSGLMGDVKGIAGIAAMATKSHVLMDFKGLDTVPPQDIHNKLKGHRYTLRNSSLAPDDAVPLTRADKDKYDQYRLTANPHPLMMRLVAGIPLIASMLAFLIFIPIVLFIPTAEIVQEKVPWLFTALAVAIKISFQTLEQAIRMMEPFYRLSCRHAPPKVLILDYTGMAFGYMPIRAFLNGDYLVGCVGLGSVLAEVLTVSVTSLVGVVGADFLPHDGQQASDSGEETILSFWFSLALSIVILAYLVIVASAVYRLRRHPFLPRQPSTIASVLAFIHQSNMLYDFVAVPPPTAERRPTFPTTTASSSSTNIITSPSTSSTALAAPAPSVLRRGIMMRSVSTVEDQSVLVQRLADMGKTYGLGWFTGRDGETHCGVDQEELRGGYRHAASEDARKATKPWLVNWEHY